MRPLLTSALAAAIVMVVLPAIPQRVDAKTGVVRCQMPDGTSAYTNRACDALGGHAMPLSAETLRRIASDQQRETALVSVQSGVEVDTRSNQLAAAVPEIASRRPVARGCAITPAQLVMDFQGSVALGDVNRIAESFDWAGMGNQQAQRIMARLEQVAHRPIRDAEFLDASVGQSAQFAGAGNQPSHDAAGLLQVTFDAGDGSSVVDLDVRRDKGCYFLRY